jgi:hypothetical protein
MTVKDIVNLLPKGHPVRIDIDYKWAGLIYSDYCPEYNCVMQEYGDYSVIGIAALDNGVYDYSTLWLKAEKPVDDNPYRISDHAIFEVSRFEYLETYKHYTILKASLNPHNSEYVVKELGFEIRWSSLAYCKKYIKEQLVKK